MEVMNDIVIEKYPAYKDLGMEWLGEIPEHWDTLPLCAVAKPKSIVNCTERELLSVYLDKGVIKFNDVDEKRTNVTSLDLSLYQAVDPGDFVLNNQQAWRGSVGVSTYTGIVSPAYFVLSLSKRLNTAFANYLFRDGAMVAQYLLCSRGVGTIQRNLIWQEFKRSIVWLPSIEEQTAIANFLDTKTAQIDKAIAQKEKLIELLKERRQILIHKAVTRGLNDGVKMKDSGVEWIGEVPEGWEVRRSKFLFTQRKEKAKEGDVQLSATQAYGVIPQEEYESMIERRVVKIQFHLEKRKHVEVDDFVISMRSFQGGLERAWSSGCIRSSYVVLKALEEIDPAFYAYLLKSPRYIEALQSTASFIRDGQDLNFENFSLVDLYIPPLNEQRSISKHLDEQIQNTKKAIEFAERRIEKLKEYKTVLINAAVTGKIKVS